MHLHKKYQDIAPWSIAIYCISDYSFWETGSWWTTRTSEMAAQTWWSTPFATTYLHVMAYGKYSDLAIDHRSLGIAAADSWNSMYYSTIIKRLLLKSMIFFDKF